MQHQFKESDQVLSNLGVPVGDKVVNEWIKNQHYDVKDKKLINISRMNREELRQFRKFNKSNQREREAHKDITVQIKKL